MTFSYRFNVRFGYWKSLFFFTLQFRSILVNSVKMMAEIFQARNGKGSTMD